MKFRLALLAMLITCNACIPIRIAPTIEDYKLVKGKRFRNGLPKKTVFVFEDPKDEAEFYNYIDTKYQLNDYYVDVEVPFQIDDEPYFLSFYEVMIEDKSLDLTPLATAILMSVALGDDDVGGYVSDDAEPLRRKGNWYIAIEVFSEAEEDCLSESYRNREKVLAYLRDLKKEYLNTDSYNELLFKD